MGLRGSLRREAIFVASVARTLNITRHVGPDKKLTIADWTERWAREIPDNPAILHEDQVVTWRMLDEGANRYARWAAAQGLGKGDVVSLLMENRPEYLMAWIGLAKNGTVAALI